MLSVTDMTGMAQLFPRHSGPTVLYLNFDGYTANGVSSFQSTRGNRNPDIQEILYRTSEIFSPFDVEVRRIYGNGNYDSSSNGNSTIFIGDNTNNGTGASNGAYAGTPWVYADFPGDVKGIHHQPNSDSFDLAYVDPVYGSSLSSWSNTQISRAIAHEAGHTFGLAHVLSSPSPEMMSYDAANTRFINQTFNITDLNNDGTSTTHDPGHAPKWYQTIDFGWFHYDFPVTITTQNSYTFLQTVLGARSTAGDLANVADSTAVDPNYVDGGMWNAGPGFNLTAYMQRPGDYDVYSLSTSKSRQVAIDVKQIAGSTLDPVLFVFDSTGQTLLAFNDDSGGTLNSRLIFSTTAGQTYKIVVGSYGSNSTGGYQLTVNNYYPWVIYTPVAAFSSISGPIESPLLTTTLTGGFSAGSGMAGASVRAMDQVFAQSAGLGTPSVPLAALLSNGDSRVISQVLSHGQRGNLPAQALYGHLAALPGAEMDLAW
jgi:hypothetical protein